MLQPELKFRRDKIRSLMVSQGIDAALITCNANLIYTYGCVVSGYLYLPLHSPALLFFKRPNNITGEHSFSIRKPEQIVDLLKEQGLPMPTKLMLEGDELPYTEYCRLASLFPEAEVVNGTPLIRQARSVKTPVEIEMFRRSGIAHAKAYEQIPSVYRSGMTDIEFSIEIERLMRLQGCLGIFRVFGRSMEIFMGSVLTGDNAGYPSPYDFALGGQGLDPALPGGANKTPLKEGQSVMVDLGGNFNGYMNDMSRVFSIGKLPEEALTAIRAHNGEMTGCAPETRFDYALRCGETITGLISAAALMRPTGYEGMEVKSIKKKMKDKAFAASVCRDNIRQCEQAGLPLDAFLALSIAAMRDCFSQPA